MSDFHWDYRDAESSRGDEEEAVLILICEEDVSTYCEMKNMMLRQEKREQ